MTAVVARLARGEDFPQIAAETGLSVRDARLHYKTAFDRLGARSSANLVALAIGHGLIPADIATLAQP